MDRVARGRRGVRTRGGISSGEVEVGGSIGVGEAREARGRRSRGRGRRSDRAATRRPHADDEMNITDINLLPEGVPLTHKKRRLWKPSFARDAGSSRSSTPILPEMDLPPPIVKNEISSPSPPISPAMPPSPAMDLPPLPPIDKPLSIVKSETSSLSPPISPAMPPSPAMDLPPLPPMDSPLSIVKSETSSPSPPISPAMPPSPAMDLSPLPPMDSPLSIVKSETSSPSPPISPAMPPSPAMDLSPLPPMDSPLSIVKSETSLPSPPISPAMPPSPAMDLSPLPPMDSPLSIVKSETSSPSPPISPVMPPSPSMLVECGGSTPSSQSLGTPNQRQREISDPLNFGSESESDVSGDEDDFRAMMVPRTYRATQIDTPLDDELDPFPPTPDAPDPFLSSSSPQPFDSPATGPTYNPHNVYDFIWKPFPVPPIEPALRRETFSQMSAPQLHVVIHMTHSF